MRPLNEFAGMLLGVAIVAAGVGAIGGVVSGGLLGACGFSPKLPITFQPSGVRGGALGAIWGSFLGTLAGTVWGAVVSAMFPAVSAGVPVELGLWRGRSWGLVWGRFGGWFRVLFGGLWGSGDINSGYTGMMGGGESGVVRRGIRNY